MRRKRANFYQTINMYIKKNSIKSVAIFFVFQCIFAQNGQVITPQQPVDWVSPLVGTDSDYGVSNGNTYPAIAMP